jgi:hypothetical protein
VEGRSGERTNGGSYGQARLDGHAGVARRDPAGEPPAPRAPAPASEPWALSWRWLAFALVFVFVAAAIAALFIENRTSALQESPAASSAIQLRATDMNGQLLITWNQHAPLVLESQRAVLHIGDGSDQADVDLDRDTLTKGSVAYVRRSGRVLLRLTIYPPGGRVDEALSFVGEPVKPGTIQPEDQ